MKLRVFLPATDRFDPAAPLAWMLFDARGEFLRGGTNACADIPRARDIEAMLPVSQVLFARLKLPRVNAATIRELLPYAVEDRLLADPANIHAVAGATNSVGETVVAVVDRESLRAKLEALGAAGLRPQRAYCESSLLAGGRNDWHVVAGAENGFLVDDDGVAVAFDRSAAGLPFAVRATLDEAAARGGKPGSVRVHAVAGAALPDLAAWSEHAGLPFVAGSHWESIAASGVPRDALELMQGEFAVGGERSTLAFVPRAAFVLLGALFVVQLALTVTDALRLQGERRELIQRQEALFREAFPQAQAVVDPPLQMARNLAELARSRGLPADDDFLVQATRAAREFPAGSARSLTYAQGRLEIQRGAAVAEAKP